MFKTVKIIGELEQQGHLDSLKNLCIKNLTQKEKNKSKNNELVKLIIFFNIDIDKRKLSVSLEQFDYNKQDKYLFQKSDDDSGSIAFLRQLKLNLSDKNIQNIQLTKKEVTCFRVIKQMFEHKVIKSALNNNNMLQKLKEFYDKHLDVELKNLTQDVVKIYQLAKQKNQGDTEKDSKSKNNQKENIIYAGFKINNYYVGEISIFAEYYNNYYYKNKFFKDSVVKKSICCICGEEKEVSCKSPYSFLTFDKPGYRSQFNVKYNYKNFPICFHCYFFIDKGKKLLDNIPLKFNQIKYYIFPKLLFHNDIKVIKRLIEIIYLNYNEYNKNTIDAYESSGRLFKLLSDEQDVILYDFVFLKEDENRSNRQKIVLYIEDVYPSRLKKIVQANDYVNQMYGTNQDIIQALCNIFFSLEKNKQNKQIAKKNYLFCLNCIFKDIKINKTWLFSHLNQYAKQQYNNVKKAKKHEIIYINELKTIHLICSFFDKLNLFA